jgi:hypothetical protein
MNKDELIELITKLVTLNSSLKRADGLDLAKIIITTLENKNLLAESCQTMPTTKIDDDDSKYCGAI